jgi:hypothetical protein
LRLEEIYDEFAPLVEAVGFDPTPAALEKWIVRRRRGEEPIPLNAVRGLADLCARLLGEPLRGATQPDGDGYDTQNGDRPSVCPLAATRENHHA